MDSSKPLAITISRQIGSGGAYVGQQLAKRLGIHYADHEILSEAAKKLSVLEETLDSRDETVQSFWESFLQYSSFTTDFYTPALITSPTSYDLFDVESEIIEHLVQEKSCVLIGRCGFHVLRKHPNHLGIFLHGATGFRSRRIQELYGLSEKEALEKIAQSDEARSAYIEAFTDREWTDARAFDLCIDTSRIGFDHAVELILNHLASRSSEAG